MQGSWFITLGTVAISAAVAFMFGRWFFSLRRSLREGDAHPDDLWPPGRTIPGREPQHDATHDQPPRDIPPGDDWI